MMRPPRIGIVIPLALAGAISACRSAPPELVKAQEQPPPVFQATPRESFVPREPRLVPAETLIRSYTAIFGDLIPPEIRKNYSVGNRKGRYFGWEEHLSALGLPDYHRDLPRVTQTNTIMVAEFERLATMLCDRSANRDLVPQPPPKTPPDAELKELVQVSAPPVFAFAVKPGPLTAAEFKPRFDVLHRTFLGYPVELAPRERLAEFHALYTRVEERHRVEKKGRPFVSAWSSVCQGLARHPEFHHY